MAERSLEERPCFVGGVLERDARRVERRPRERPAAVPRERRRYSRDENQMAEEERYRFVDLTGVVDESKAPRADNGRYRFDASVSWLALRLIQRRLSARSYASPALLVPLGTFLGLG